MSCSNGFSIDLDLNGAECWNDCLPATHTLWYPQMHVASCIVCFNREQSTLASRQACDDMRPNDAFTTASAAAFNEIGAVHCEYGTYWLSCYYIWYAFSAIDFFVRCRRCLIDVKRWREMKTNVSILITMNTDGCVFDFPFIRRALPNPSNNCQCLCSQPILTSVIFAILCLSAYVERKALAFFLFNPISVAAFSASNNILEVVVRCVAGVRADKCEPPRFMQNWHWQWRSSCARVE